MTIQEQIDALPSSGGTVHVEPCTITEPINLTGKSGVRLIGYGRWKVIRAELTTPGPAIYMCGSTQCELANFGIKGQANVETGILLCRETYNGRQSGRAYLHDLNLYGGYSHAALCSLGCESNSYERVHIRQECAAAYCYYSSSEVPAGLHAPGPICAGSNTVVRLSGCTAVAGPDGYGYAIVGGATSGVNRSHQILGGFLACGAGRVKVPSPTARAAVVLANCDQITLDGLKLESGQSLIGLHVAGNVSRLRVSGCQIQGWVPVYVDKSVEYTRSVIDETNLIESFMEDTV